MLDDEVGIVEKMSSMRKCVQSKDSCVARNGFLYETSQWVNNCFW